MWVLIVDDDSSVRQMLSRWLVVHAIEAVTAGDVAEMSRLVQERTPAVVVSDVGLPDGNGIDACIALRQESPQLPCIIMTGDQRQLARARAFGFPALQKPFDPGELVRMLLTLPPGRIPNE